MNNLVIGTGQIGWPLMATLTTAYPIVFGRDEESVPNLPTIDAVHICFPYSDEFVNCVVRYVKEYQPSLCIIHSTVVPGTTDNINCQIGADVVYSPVRGRHNSMINDLGRYTKFVAGNKSGVEAALSLFKAAGIKACRFPSVRGLELAKLLSTTYSGLLIAWAQEMERYCTAVGMAYLDLLPFFAEIDYLPRVAFQPGYIGGHCIMPNLELLSEILESSFITAIKESNDKMSGVSSDERLYPIPMDKFL
jgi:UDP-N-acetyl-D-mannosaminuronate dehydrogenase